MEKYKNQNGDVAVLISGGFGAGWSTWNSGYAEEMLFDRDIVKLMIDDPTRPHLVVRPTNKTLEEIKELAKTKWPKAYLGGLGSLEVEWLKPGTEFMVHEYDGSEEIWTKDMIEKYIA